MAGQAPTVHLRAPGAYMPLADSDSGYTSGSLPSPGEPDHMDSVQTPYGPGRFEYVPMEMHAPIPKEEPRDLRRMDSLMALAAVATADLNAMEASKTPAKKGNRGRKGKKKEAKEMGGGVLKRRSSEEGLSVEQRSQRRREKNREAAQLCRLKKKEQLTQMRGVVDQLTQENHALTMRVELLTADKTRLQRMTEDLMVSNKLMDQELQQLRACWIADGRPLPQM
eukprot:comp23966_c0_seq1/m.42480 comp23966_c0_seq1/g.42480  ORF comp23966_c0_seq1/g.42480 comp23966_c0_seq1/m.42480 type:complete len:224 (-) comp23966_c0_seq1:501-1172(-)